MLLWSPCSQIEASHLRVTLLAKRKFAWTKGSCSCCC